MKKISLFGILSMALFVCHAHANYSPARFQDEVLTGLDIIGATANMNTTPARADGELGLEVYEIADTVSSDDMRIFIPTSMYMRMGGGLNLGFATDQAKYLGKKYNASGGYTTQIGLGWNLSS